jgi:elongation factor P
MLTINDIKVGTVIDWRGAPHEAIFVEHSKQGRGGAVLRTKLRNLQTGAIIDNTFKGNDRVEGVDLTYRQAQYLYQEGNKLVFMDNESYEQIELPKEVASSDFLKEGTNVDLVLVNNKALNVRIPIKSDFEVTYTEPGFKGNTQSSALKPATIETGAQVQVPLFINIGDKIRIDTRNGQYVERVK